MAAGVADDNELESFRKCAAICCAIAGKNNKALSAFEIPQPHRAVIRHRDRALLVLTRRHAIDAIRVALERAELAPAAQIPHLQRVAI